MMKRMTLMAVLLVSAGLWSAPALAKMTCSVSGTGIAFGIYDPLSGSNLDNAGTVTVSCTRQFLDNTFEVSFEVRFNAGGSGSAEKRTMNSGADALEYNLYTTPARNTIWGDRTGGTEVRTGFLEFGLFNYGPKAADFTVYGRIFGGQLVPAGSYSDAIMVTVLY